MKTTSRSRSLTRSLMALFVPKKSVNAHQLYPDDYYRQIFFDKKMFDGIAWVAKFERVSKKKAARMLMERGFGDWLQQKLKEDRAIRKLENEPQLTRFILSLQKFAKEHGMDIKKFKF
jgi:hypothetical protein